MINPQLEALGYTALQFEDDNYGDPYTLAVFRPEQVKSATGNTGAFNPDTGVIIEDAGQPSGDALAAARAGAIPPAASALRGVRQAAMQQATAALTGRGTPAQRRREALPYLRQISDSITEWFADGMIPMLRWVQALPIPKGMQDAISNAMYLARVFGTPS